MKEVNIKRGYKILTGGLILLGLLFYVSLPAAAPETTVPSDGLIRLHVLANSDSEADQALKRKVRDEIIQAMAPEFLVSGDIDSARLTAQANLNRIKLIASRVIQEEGKDYPVTAELDTFPFPTKHYGAFILPAGEYEAVRVVIGSGGGANWWCVLFPPLCFVDMSKTASIDTPVMGFPANTPTPKVATAKKPAQHLEAQTTADVNEAVTCIPNEQQLENHKTQAAEGVNNMAISEKDDGKVIFSFKLVEFFRRL